MNLTTIKDFLKENWFSVILVTLLTFSVLSWLDSFREKNRLHQELIGKTEEFEQLSEFAANLERQYVDQETLLKKVTEEFEKEKSSLRGRIKMLSNATFLIREKAREMPESDLIYKGNKLKYVVNEIRYQDGPPIGYVLIFDNGAVTSKIYDHVIDVKTVVSRDESRGTYDVISKADFILKSPSLGNSGNWFNKPHPLKITGGTATIDPTEPRRDFKRFHFWAPNVNANFNVSTNGISPGLGLSLMGYGYSRRDLDFKLLQLGAQHNDERGLGLTFTPILWRPFSGVISNTYIGPGMSVDVDGTNYFFGVQIGL